MRIGVIGGTFDPIHKGHIAVAEHAMDEYGLDEVWFMPAGDPYFKAGNNVTSPDVRLRMTQACIEGCRQGFSVSDFEIRKAGRTYSSETFRELRQLYPSDRFYFILGMDSLNAIDRWYRPDILFENAVILCAGRGDSEEPEEIGARINELKGVFGDICDIRIIHMNRIDISSTEIRRRFSEGLDIRHMVTDAVYEFICRNGLYTDKSGEV